MNSSSENYGCELFNLSGMVRKTEFILIFTTAVCKCWDVSDKYTWDNAKDLNQLSMDQIRHGGKHMLGILPIIWIPGFIDLYQLNCQ